MKRITAIMLTLALLAAMTSCNGNTNTPADTDITTVGDDAHIVPTETTEIVTTAPVETVDIDAMLDGYTVYEVTTENVMYTMNADDPENAYDVQLKDYHTPYMRFEERWEKGESFSEKVAIRFTDLDRLTIFVNMWTKDKSLYSEISHMIYGNNVIECSESVQYSLRSFSVIASDEIIALPGNYQTDTYFLSKDGYINLHTVRDEGNSMSKLDVFVYENMIKYNYTNTLFSDVVSLGGELRDDYNSDDDLYAEYGKVVLENGVPRLEMTSSITIGEWYQSDDFPYAKIRDKYEFKTLRDMAKRFKTTAGYQEFIEIYEELEGD